MSEEDLVPLRPIGARALLSRGALAIAISLVANLALLGAVETADLVAPFGALSVLPVSLLTVLTASAATAVYGIVRRVSTAPDRIFTMIAAVVLALSLLPDLLLIVYDPGATVSAVLVLMVMHVIVATVCVVVLTDRYR